MNWIKYKCLNGNTSWAGKNGEGYFRVVPFLWKNKIMYSIGPSDENLITKSEEGLVFENQFEAFKYVEETYGKKEIR